MIRMKCDELQYERLGEANWAYPASTLVIRKQFVDEAIAELKDIAENACLERDDNQTAIDELEDENRKLKRALWMARQIPQESGGVQMKLAFTIHWYGGYPANVPTTHETYIADIPNDLLPAEVREQLAGNNRDTEMTISIVKEADK